MKKRQKIGKDRRQRLIRDLVAAQHDLITLADQHRLRADDLAQWISDPDNQFTLAGLCRLADLQTQVLLSRYRLLAAGQLVKLATQANPDQPAAANDVARKACVDLLKLDLKRADLEDSLAAQTPMDTDEALIPAWLATLDPLLGKDSPIADPPIPASVDHTLSGQIPGAADHRNHTGHPQQTPKEPSQSSRDRRAAREPVGGIPEPAAKNKSHLNTSSLSSPECDAPRLTPPTQAPQDHTALRDWLYSTTTDQS